MIAYVTLALIVIFGAALAGKMLMEMYPDSGFNIFRKKKNNSTTPAE